MSSFGKDLVQSAREALAIAKGKAKPAKRIDVDTVDIAALRKRLRLSQNRFAERFGLAPATVRDWEQGRRRPDTTARILLKVIERQPKAVIAALKS